MSERDALLQAGDSPVEHLSYEIRDDSEEDDTRSLSSPLQPLESNALLRAQGHVPEMERSFSPLAALGLGFSITNSWVGYLSCFGQNLAYAGPNNVVFGLLAAVVIQWVISVGLYEIASCFPSSGGQYHFVFLLAPKDYKKFAAFTVGWMNLIGWFVALCSGISCVVASVAGLIALWSPEFHATQLQLYIIYISIVAISACPVFFASRAIPKILQASLVFSVVGFAVVLILLLSLRRQSQSSAFLLNTEGSSGWDTGIAWTLGITNAMYPFSSTDAAIHIAEEMVQPEKRLPQTLNMTLAIGFLTAFPLLLFLMLSMTDVDSVVQSTLPYAELFFQATGSTVVTTFVICWVTMALFSALIGIWVTCGRLAWAFARDGGLPYTDYFAHISKRYKFPVRATTLPLAFCFIYGLLYLVSTTAFNSIVTSAVLFSNITYCIPQVILIIKGRQNVLPRRDFNLGRVGRLCNLLSPILVLALGIFICFPPELPLTRYNINYTPAVLAGCYLAILTGWYTTGKKFRGPKIDWSSATKAQAT